MYHQDLEAFGDLGDRREILDRSISGADRDRRDHCQCAGVAEQQRIAVGL